jgi:hypothetical protein
MCSLIGPLGAVEECPGVRCPFWQGGPDGDCGLEGVRGGPDAAAAQAFLREVRMVVECMWERPSRFTYRPA